MVAPTSPHRPLARCKHLLATKPYSCWRKSSRVPLNLMVPPSASNGGTSAARNAHRSLRPIPFVFSQSPTFTSNRNIYFISVLRGSLRALAFESHIHHVTLVAHPRGLTWQTSHGPLRWHSVDPWPPRLSPPDDNNRMALLDSIIRDGAKELAVASLPSLFRPRTTTSTSILLSETHVYDHISPNPRINGTS